MVTALSCAVYCKGALYLILSFDCGSEPPWALEEVDIDTSEKPPIVPDNVNEEAPFASVLLVTIYSKVIMFPSDTDLPKTPSPK